MTPIDSHTSSLRRATALSSCLYGLPCGLARTLRSQGMPAGRTRSERGQTGH